MPQITPDEIAEVLFTSIKPFYKGFPLKGHEPQFRKSLTGEEVENLLSAIHHVITTIYIMKEGDDSVER